MTPRVQNGKLKARTRDEYAAILRRHVLPKWRRVPVGAITSQRAERWARDLAGRGLSARTYRHAWDMFARVLKYAVRHDILITNPADRVELGSPRADNADEFEGTALLAEQVVAVVQQVGERYPVYGVMVQFLAYTGLRAAELAGLDVGDLTLVRAEGRVTGAVRVARTRRKCRGGWQVDTPKSRASRRTVPLDDWLAGILANYLDETHPRGTDPGAPLFPHRKPGRAQTGGVAERQARLDWDQPIEPSSFYRNVFQPAVRAAGLPRTRLHDLRHTFATMQLRAGPPDHYMQVSVWMGHADYAVTLKHYAHVIKRPDGTKAHQVGPPPRVVAVELPGATEEPGSTRANRRGGSARDLPGRAPRWSAWIAIYVGLAHDCRKMINSLAVPGTFAPNVGLVDVETCKVPAPPHFVMPSGEPLRKRWSVVAAGLASVGLVELVAEPTEAETLRELGWRAAGLSELRYGATRKFDEMILRGRFTNARRAHLPEPAWPAMPGAESAKWVNVSTAKSGVERLPDIPSRDVPAAWGRGDRLVVLVHLLRDVADLILVAGEPDDAAAEWCERVLGEPGFAEGLLAAA